MQETVDQALLMLLIGIITVFIILFVVVLISRVLIWYTNTFYPDSNPIKQKTPVDKKKVAAIITAVNVVTQGKGKVISIKK